MRIRTAVVLATAALCFPPAAYSQLPTIPPAPGLPPSGGGGTPEHQDPPPAPSGPGAAQGEIVSYRGGPGHAAATTDEAVFGPLERAWTRTFPDGVSQPLIVAGKVIVNVGDAGDYAGSHVLAIDPATGKTLWSQEAPGIQYSVPIAANSGRVFAVNSGGAVRAIDVETGALAWDVTLPKRYPYSPPVAAGGALFIHTEGDPLSRIDPELYALSAADGHVLWHVKTSIRVYAWPTLDDQRVFLADGCGHAQAYAQTTGQLVWERNPGSDCRGGGPSVVAGGRLFLPSDGGLAFDAATGADAPALGGAPEAVFGDLAYLPGRRAVPLSGGPARWKFTDPPRSGVGAVPLSPFVVGPTVYVAGAGYKLYGLDRLTGEELSVTQVPHRDHEDLQVDVKPGIAAGASVLLTAAEDQLTAFRSLFRPGADGIDIAADGFDVISGRRRTVAGGLGSAIRHSTPKVKVRLAEHPYRRHRTAGSLKVLADGTAYGRIRMWRNTRIRLVARGHSSPKITIYAVPRTRSRLRRTSPTHGVLKVTMRADRHFRVAGRRLVLYVGRAGKRRYERLGVGHMSQAGRGRARGSVGFRLLRHVGAKDTVAFCVQGLPRLGYGRNDGFQRSCGRGRISFRAASRR